jgi:uncharacterized protein (DUF952 family)
MTPIYHIARASDWQSAQAASTYRVSTRDQSLEEVGFIHCSRAHQVAGVANGFYQGERDLVLLVIDPDRLAAPLQLEPPAPGMEAYPHIYGPLNLDAVIQVIPYETAEDGSFGPPQIELS